MSFQDPELSLNCSRGGPWGMGLALAYCLPWDTQGTETIHLSPVLPLVYLIPDMVFTVSSHDTFPENGCVVDSSKQSFGITITFL